MRNRYFEWSDQDTHLFQVIGRPRFDQLATPPEIRAAFTKAQNAG